MLCICQNFIHKSKSQLYRTTILMHQIYIRKARSSSEYMQELILNKQRIPVATLSCYLVPICVRFYVNQFST